MRKPHHTPAGQAITALVLEVFRLNGSLLAAGDRLVAALSLTSARWQVLGAIALADTPRPVAHLARGMGLQRQGVQRIVHELAEEGLVSLAPNPHHKRAQLVVLTPRGQHAYDQASRRQIPWANALSAPLDHAAIGAATDLLQQIRTRLDDGSIGVHGPWKL